MGMLFETSVRRGYALFTKRWKPLIMILENLLEVVNGIRRRNAVTGDNRVTRKILKSKEGIPENFLEASG
jgi:hypothetical protein